MEKRIRLLCLDIDGTLLDSRKELPQENVQAVRYAMDRGVTVAIASGRSMSGMLPLFKTLGIRPCGVGLNGGLILDGDVVKQTIMDAELVQIVIAAAERYDSQIFLSTADCNYTNGKVSDHLKKLIENGGLKSDFVYCNDFDDLREKATEHKEEIVKIAIKEVEEDHYEQLRKELGQMGLFHVAKSDTFYVDINPLGCNKGMGVRELAEYLNIPMEEVMCIGDNENDEEMVEIAGVGVAMANAVETVKRKADFITGDNDHAGVARAVYHYIGGDEL